LFSPSFLASSPRGMMFGMPFFSMILLILVPPGVMGVWVRPLWTSPVEIAPSGALRVAVLGSVWHDGRQELKGSWSRPQEEIRGI
jgi:hypothetical protein